MGVVRMGENVLDQIVTILIARNCRYRSMRSLYRDNFLLTINQGDARTILTTFADTLQIAFKELRTANLEALFDDFGSKLIHAVFCGIAKHMVNSTGPVLRGPMLTNVLDAPIAELTMGNNVNIIENLVNTGTLQCISKGTHILHIQATDFIFL